MTLNLHKPKHASSHNVPTSGHGLARGVSNLSAAPADIAHNGPSGTIEDASPIGSVQKASVRSDDGRRLVGTWNKGEATDIGSDLINGVGVLPMRT